MALAMPEVYPVACHTDHIGQGSTFVAIKGFKEDGITYIPTALHKGATTIVVAHDAMVPDVVRQQIIAHDARLVAVDDVRKTLAELSAHAAGNPAQKLRLIGVTGTKGKTTTVHLIAHILRTAGHRVALLSTTQNKIEDVHFDTCLTTAQPDYLHQFLALCVNQQITFVVMEVAAQAISLSRIAGLTFESVVITNLFLEHLEFYATLEDYFNAKFQLLAQRSSATSPAFINSDNEPSVQASKKYANCFSFGLDDSAHTHAVLHPNRRRIRAVVNSGSATFEIDCPTLIGTFNAYNALAAISVALHYQIDTALIAQALRTFTPVPGRFEQHLIDNNITVIIDYASNPASYEMVLPMLRSMTDHLIVVFGAGGQRDASKRPLMGTLAACWADQIILTSDNPRTQDPQAIIADILAGIDSTMHHKVTCIVDRRTAIYQAWHYAQPGSIIALLGKGAENYQLIGCVKTPFSERSIVQELIGQIKESSPLNGSTSSARPLSNA